MGGFSYIPYQNAAYESEYIGGADSATAARILKEVNNIKEKIDEGATGGNVNNITVNEAPDEVMNYEADN